MENVNQVMAELERMNLSPVMDGKTVSFTYQGAKYMYYDFEMEGYMFFTTHVADLHEASLIDIFKAINTVNKQLHFGKLTLHDDCVLASYEYLMPDDAKMEFVILNAFSTLSYARNKFYSEMENVGVMIK